MKKLLYSLVVVLSTASFAYCDTEPVVLTATVAQMLGTAVTQPNFGTFYQRSTGQQVTFSLYTNGQVSSSNPAVVMPLTGTGAQAGRLQVEGGTGSTAIFTFSGIAANGNINLTSTSGGSMVANLTETTTPQASTGPVITTAPFNCALVSGACTVYLGALITVPATLVPAGSYASNGVEVTVTYQ